MFSITLRQLEVFEAVVRDGGFAAASARLDIAQASVSAHITALEAQVGAAIFERHPGRRPTLTRAGEVVLRHAAQILTTARALEQELGGTGRAPAERLVFSCQRSLAQSMQAELARFAFEHPEIELVIRIGTIEEVIAHIRSGGADIGQFVSYETVSVVRSRIMGQTLLVVVAAPDHPLAGARRIDPSVLAGFPFVGPPPSMFGRAVRQVLQDVGVPTVNIVAQTTEYQPMRELVLARVGLACSFHTSVARDLAEGRLVALDLAAAPMLLDVRIATTDRRVLPPVAQTFFDFLATVQAAGIAADAPA